MPDNWAGIQCFSVIPCNQFLIGQLNFFPWLQNNKLLNFIHL